VVGGAGLLAVACDLRVAASDLAYSIPELHLGIPLTWGGLPRLVREIGLPRTRELVLTGRVIGAAEALSFGLVHRVGERREEPTQALVDELLAMPEAPLAMTKDALRALGEVLVGSGTAWADADLLSTSGPQPEAREAAAAYLDRLRRRSSE
jgi:enoyl-CoA hydratase/carnithine racemase